MQAEVSKIFSGFKQDGNKFVRIPEEFFTQLLPIIENHSQLQLLLYMFWHLEQQEGKIHYFRVAELISDTTLVNMIGSEDALIKALEGLINFGILLKADLEWMNETYYFLNSPQGRASVAAIEKGEWQASSENRSPIHLTGERPNIYKLYEENIGTITPMMADILKADEAEYPASWIEQAIRIAVARNARNWKYVQAILKRWHEEGRGDEQNRRDDWQDSGSYRESWLGDD